MAEKRTVMRFSYDVCEKHHRIFFSGRWADRSYAINYLREVARKYEISLTTNEVPCDKCREETTITLSKRKCVVISY